MLYRRIPLGPMLVICIWVCAIIGSTDAVYAPNRPDQILDLSHENFTEAIGSNHMLLVDFYAPWCSYCTNLKTELQMVAMDLPNMNIDGRIAMIDASTVENEAMSLEEGIDGFPSIVLYRDGQRQGDYHGPRTRLDILEYLKKKAGPPAIPVSTREEIDSYLNHIRNQNAMGIDVNDFHAHQAAGDTTGYPEGQLSVALALFLPEVQDSNKGVYGPVCKSIVSLASNYEQIQFLYADNLDLISFYDIQEDSLIVFTDSSAHPATIISLKQEAVLDNKFAEKFLITRILAHSLPPLIPYSTHTQPFISALPIRNHVLVFHDFNERSRRVLEMLLPVTMPYRSELVFITISSEEHQLLQFFGIEPSGGLPELVVASMEDPLRMRRYNLRDHMAQQQLKDSSAAAAAADEISTNGNSDSVNGDGAAVDGDTATAGAGAGDNLYRSKKEMLTPDVVKSFLDSFLQGGLTPSIFSEVKKGGGDAVGSAAGSSAASDNSKNTNNKKQKKVYAKPLVGAQFTEMVISGASNPQDRDIFLYVHAPWCGHCKSFEPVIEDLAKLYRRDENLQFYRIDGSKNEIDHAGVRVRGFPALYLFPAGEKDSPVEYLGERDAASIARFLKSFRTTKNSNKKPNPAAASGDTAETPEL
jgi:thiol-disulfide isomerase/thioredoxin